MERSLTPMALLALALAACGGAGTPDLSISADLATPPDAAMATVDMATPPDLATPPADLAKPPMIDQATTPADLASNLDLTAPPKTLTVNVGAGGSFFDPPNVFIAVGDTVHWVWLAGGHNVVSGMGGVADKKFCSPNGMNCGAAPVSAAGTIYDVKFTQAGMYPYYCAPHIGAGMKGSVTVQ